MKMWDGRFSKPSDTLMEKFHNSLSFDIELIEEDIQGSIAWAHALEKINILTKTELETIQNALLKILDDYKVGKLEFLPGDEDVHMAVERILIERIGDCGAKLHTGRSRNDQVATDTRLYSIHKVKLLIEKIVALQKALIFRAETDIQAIMPGFTHLQQAQAILLSHYWLSFFWALEREKSRCEHALQSADLMPLGSGAIAGSGFPVDRKHIASILGFNIISQNSIDGVASRDFLLEILASIASIGILLSRYAEDSIIWSSKEFGFIDLDDAWATGSSMMPQKKNPDSLELIRGKTGRFIGNYTRFATTLKGVGLTYYKDLQEDKEPLFDSLYHIDLTIDVYTNILKTLKVNYSKLQSDLDPFLIATDLADYLVRKGMPFRQSHKVIGKIVGYCIETSTPPNSLTLLKYKEFSPLFEQDLFELFSWQKAIDYRSVDGGTSTANVKKQIFDAMIVLNK